MGRWKKTLFIFVSTILLLFIAGCQKDSALPENAQESHTETAVEQAELEQDELDELDAVKEEKAEDEEKESNEKADSNEEAEKENKQQTDTTANNEETPKNTEANNRNNINAHTTNNTTASNSKAVTQEQKSTNKQTEQRKTTPKQENSSNSQAKQQQAPAPTPTPAPAPKQEAKPKEMVTISVQGVNGTVLSATNVEIGSGDTVLSATQKILKKKGIPISVRGSGANAYVEGIANQFEFDHGPQSGWKVKRNGSYMSRSSGAEPVTNGDRIEWVYSTEG